MADLLKPSVPLLCKLASIAVHADEYTSPGAHDFDLQALKALLVDPEVAGWLTAMTDASLAPRSRILPAVKAKPHER